MVDEKTLIVKITDDLFTKYFQAKIIETTINLANFMKEIKLFKNIPYFVFVELSKFVRIHQTQTSEVLIQKDEKSKDIFFIKSGKV
jgi:hypothetical protein